jgi:hypothetical protein
VFICLSYFVSNYMFLTSDVIWRRVGLVSVLNLGLRMEKYLKFRGTDLVIVCIVRKKNHKNYWSRYRVNLPVLKTSEILPYQQICSDYNRILV